MGFLGDNVDFPCGVFLGVVRAIIPEDGRSVDWLCWSLPLVECRLGRFRTLPPESDEVEDETDEEVEGDGDSDEGRVAYLRLPLGTWLSPPTTGDGAFVPVTLVRDKFFGVRGLWSLERRDWESWLMWLLLLLPLLGERADVDEERSWARNLELPLGVVDDPRRCGDVWRSSPIARGREVDCVAKEEAGLVATSKAV